jgi:hypothetical protein
MSFLKSLFSSRESGATATAEPPLAPSAASPEFVNAPPSPPSAAGAAVPLAGGLSMGVDHAMPLGAQSVASHRRTFLERVAPEADPLRQMMADLEVAGIAFHRPGWLEITRGSGTRIDEVRATHRGAFGYPAAVQEKALAFAVMLFGGKPGPAEGLQAQHDQLRQSCSWSAQVPPLGELMEEVASMSAEALQKCEATLAKMCADSSATAAASPDSPPGKLRGRDLSVETINRQLADGGDRNAQAALTKAAADAALPRHQRGPLFGKARAAAAFNAQFKKAIR